MVHRAYNHDRYSTVPKPGRRSSGDAVLGVEDVETPGDQCLQGLGKNIDIPEDPLLQGGCGS